MNGSFFKSKNIFRIILCVIILTVITELIYSNTYIQTENFTYSDEDIPQSFDGVKIVHISDYHNHGGSYDDRLIKEVTGCNPDYIFLTGDIADSICTDIDKACGFLKKISETAPCYLVWGNHDYDIDADELGKMRECAEENGISVLENGFEYIERGDDKILIAGTVNTNTEDMMKNFPTDEKMVLWLHHYPEDFREISTVSESAGSKAKLLFTGHAHGGLIRFLFVNGLYAPGQGFFPQYTSGQYEYNGSEMLVSRGVGNSGFTRRFADTFHIVVCTLEKSDN